MLLIDEFTNARPNPTANPNYHKATDTVDTLNLSFHHRVTQATLAAVSALTNE